VLDKRLLEKIGIEAGAEVEVSTDGRVIVVAPVRSKARARKLAAAVEDAHARYEGVFRKLAE
jgi:antitoxin component of MazEF toxin-antitoxin module